MLPKLNGFDHIHIDVLSRKKAAEWYKNILGFTIVKSLTSWAQEEEGPLTIKDPSGKIHLALFKNKNNFKPSAAIAFNVEGKEFIKWEDYLKKQNILLRLSDHKVAWSIYFKDLYNNSHELTTYDYDHVLDCLGHPKK